MGNVKKDSTKPKPCTDGAKCKSCDGRGYKPGFYSVIYYDSPTQTIAIEKKHVRRPERSDTCRSRREPFVARRRHTARHRHRRRNEGPKKSRRQASQGSVSQTRREPCQTELYLDACSIIICKKK